MLIPFTLDMTLAYIAYLRGKPKTCRAETIEKYFSGLRMAHLEEGYNPTCLRVNIVKQILNGAAQMDMEKEKLENRPERLAVTVPVLILLKQAIKCKKEWSLSRKRLVWVVATLAFAGSFRIHELLSKDSETYDQTQTLLGSDVREIKTEIEGKKMNILVVYLKSPKEQKLAKGVNVEIFPYSLKMFCPILAYTKWKEISSVKYILSKPVFREDSGNCYTGKKFNNDLRTLLSPHMNYDQGRILAHSFRQVMDRS